jgi:hypothetical protein
LVQQKEGGTLYSSDWKNFRIKANKFLQKTEENAMQGINPGGYYYAIWCRDASYILRDWFLSGHVHEVLRHLYLIWSHQVGDDNDDSNDKSREPQEKEKIVYGRGSPEEKFKTATLQEDLRKSFDGALPTTIYQAGYSEIYGKNPDIDSTALMISTTAWVLSHVLDEHNKQKQAHNRVKDIDQPIRMKVASHRTASLDPVESRSILQDPIALADHLSEKMSRAVRYLSSRDSDGDGLLEQGPNEDWMDTAMRSGKIVYSQAAWIMALNNFTMLLSKMNSPTRGNDAGMMMMTAKDTASLANQAIQAAEDILWSEEEGSYVDIHAGYHIGKVYRLLTQDVLLYLVAITENTGNDPLRASETTKGRTKNPGAEKLHISQNKLHRRSLSALNEVKKRVWKEKWPLITEALLDTTGPWVLKPFQYHNHTFWPWITGIEMLARSRFEMVEDCNMLLSTLASDGHPHTHAFYEWINPLNDKGNGAFPFRTGIAEVRIALTDILASTSEV